MAYSEELAKRVRGILSRRSDIAELKMFGGLAFMLNGNMACGIMGDRLMLRIAPDRYETALSQPHVLPMQFTGRTMKNMVIVEPDGIRTSKMLEVWVKEAIDFASALPPKQKAKKKKK